MVKRILVLQDIAPDFDACEVLGLQNEGQVRTVYAGRKAARCKGCFGCWLKTPGQCVMHDGSERIGAELMTSDLVYILSRTCYGGFSVETKRMLDRSIPGVLPFFRYVCGKMHHVPRFRVKPEYRIAFYEMAGCSESERETAVKAAKAMSVNFNARACRVVLFDGPITAKEAVSI